MIQPVSPLTETNMLLRAIIIVLVMGKPPPEQIEGFLGSLGIRIGDSGDAPDDPQPERSEIVEFPDRSPKGAA